MRPGTRIAKETLLEALAAKLPLAEQYDREVLKKHRAENKQRAKERRDYFRRFIAMDDDELAELRRYGIIGDDFPQSTSCPVSKVEEIKQAIRWLEAEPIKHKTVRQGDDYGRILTFTGEHESAAVC